MGHARQAVPCTTQFWITRSWRPRGPPNGSTRSKDATVRFRVSILHDNDLDTKQLPEECLHGKPFRQRSHGVASLKVLIHLRYNPRE